METRVNASENLPVHTACFDKTLGVTIALETNAQRLKKEEPTVRAYDPPVRRSLVKLQEDHDFTAQLEIQEKKSCLGGILLKGK